MRIRTFVLLCFGALVLAGALGSALDSATSTSSPATTQAAAATTPAASAVPTETVSLKVRRTPSTRSSSVLLKGKVTDGSDVYVNDEPATVSGRKWWTRVNLDRGPNDIEISADHANLKSNATVATVTRTAPKHRKRRRAQRSSSTASSPPAAAPSSSSSAGSQSFSGNGRKNLGDITVPSESVIEWTNQNTDLPDLRSLMISDDGFKIGVSSDATSGTSVLPAGTYKNVDVMGDDWTITIRPR